jgi:hypothetical protein
MRIEFNGPSHGSDGFRSRLEFEVAQELDEHDVDWGYEQPVILPDGASPHYLPDFTIHESDDELELPQWVEAKPQQFLYDLRDTLGVTRRAGEKFSGGVSVDGVMHSDLKSMGIDELWKPKLLAEITGETVLVVGGVGGSSKLTVDMTPRGVHFRRDHPFANWAGVLKRQEAERQRQEAAERHAEYERQREQREAEWNARRHQVHRNIDLARKVMLHKDCGAPRFESPCSGCNVATLTGTLYKVDLVGGGSRWMIVCQACKAAAKA